MIVVEDNKSESGKQDKYFFYALLVGSLASALAILSKETLNTGQIVAASSFSVAIPLLSLIVLVANSSELKGYRITSPLLDVVSAVALLSSHVGYIALFFSLNKYAGIASLVSVLIFVFLFFKVSKLINEAVKVRNSNV